MSERRQSSRYLLRRIRAAHAILANPLATDAQRRGARCRLNRTIETLKGLESVPMMTPEKRQRLLGVDDVTAAA